MASVDVVVSMTLWPSRNETTVQVQSQAFQSYVQTSLSAFDVNDIVDADIGSTVGLLGAASTYMQRSEEAQELFADPVNVRALRDATTNVQTIASSFDVTLSPAIASGLVHISRVCARFDVCCMSARMWNQDS